MALQPWQLGPNSKLNVGGSDGYVARHDAVLTYIAREDGSVDIFTTEFVLNESTYVLSDSEKAVQSSDEQAKDQRISELESQLQQIKSSQVPGTGPAAVSQGSAMYPPAEQGPAAVSLDPSVSPESAQPSNPFESSPSTGPDTPAAAVSPPVESPTSVSATPNEQAPSTSPGQASSGEESNRQQTQ